MCMLKFPTDWAQATGCRAGAILLVIALLTAATLLGCGDETDDANGGNRVSAGEAASPTGTSFVATAQLKPLLAHVDRLRQMMIALGAPFAMQTQALLDRAAQENDEDKSRQLIQQALDPYCLASVDFAPDGRVTAAPGLAKLELVENGWRPFLIKVRNRAAITAQLEVTSPQAEATANAPPDQVADRWLGVSTRQSYPLNPKLTGIELQYRVIQLYSRDAGQRTASLMFHIELDTQRIGSSNDLTLAFDCRPATEVTFRVHDHNGSPTTARFYIHDRSQRFYPLPAKRRAPDLHFHPQIYRADGEKVRLPPGRYNVELGRGPEYLPSRRLMTVGDAPQTETFHLERWIDPVEFGYYSGDHHLHAAGCNHYLSPTQGVGPIDMIRQCIGEDLKIGVSLNWGPAFEHQSQYFTGRDNEVSQHPYLLHYDVEVSRFGSHESGHLCLLGLKEQAPPGAESKHRWPTLGLNTLRWAKKQGAVCGTVHSGLGMVVETDELPNYIVPPYDSIGAHEFIVDVTHTVPGPNDQPVPAIDFFALCDTPYVWELNTWYHVLNCGFRPRAAGESDFPCLYHERVGMGRSYVKVDGELTYEKWCDGLRRGQSYVGHGQSHLIDFAVGGVEAGSNLSELRLDESGIVRVAAHVAAWLSPQPDPSIGDRHYSKKPYWHLERARLGDSRDVTVELIVNGYPVASKRITADGTLREISFDITIERSSWVAMRILPSSHTNPVFVLVGDTPIRASRRSAEWCLRGVDQCWRQKSRFIAAAEMQDAVAAYDHARRTYQQIMAESPVE